MTKELESSIVKTHGKNIWRKFIKITENNRLLRPGDRIGVFVSGSPESMLCAKLLEMASRYGMYEIQVQVFHMSNNPEMGKGVAALGQEMGLLVEVLEDMEPVQDRQTCFSRMAKIAKERGCHKIALGECSRQAVNEILFGVLYEGVIQGVLPLEQIGEMTLIRPLYAMRSEDIAFWAEDTNLCFEGHSILNLEEKQPLLDAIQVLVEDLNKKNTAVFDNVFGCIDHVSMRKVPGYIKDGMHHSFLEDYDSTF